MSKTIGTLSRLKYLLPQSIMLTLYNSLILPCITYGVVAWGNTNSGQIKRMSLLQKRAVRIVSNAKYNSHTSPIFKSFNLLTLPDIFQLECCKLYAKFRHDQLPHYLKEQFDTTNRVNHSYNIRNNNDILPPLVKSKFEEQLIQFKVSKAWNSLPIPIRSFKENIIYPIKFICNRIKSYKLDNYSSACQMSNCYVCNTP